jgi:hypothetical protein
MGFVLNQLQFLADNHLLTDKESLRRCTENFASDYVRIVLVGRDLVSYSSYSSKLWNVIPPVVCESLWYCFLLVQRRDTIAKQVIE